MEALTNSKRLLFTASYSVTQLTTDEQQQLAETPSRAIEKINIMHAMRIQPEEIRPLSKAASKFPNERIQSDLKAMLPLMRHLHARPSQQMNLAEVSKVGRISTTAISTMADLLADIRLSPEAHNFAQGVKQVFAYSPVGRLHLERLEMYPVGTEQGELVFTVPLAPEETVTVSHKEWATSSQEFENIVQDFFESYSERGVAEKTDVAMSTESEARHAQGFTFGATLAGGYGPVSLTTTIGLTNASEERNALKQSVQKNRDVTEKASARTRKEHKVSVKLESKKGTEDSSFRTITNPHKDKALRIDYFRMMRKWRTDLFRYGLRLTYDIVVPNPAVRLWARYRELAALDRQIRESWNFSVAVQDITDASWPGLAARFRAPLEPPPAKNISLTVSRVLQNPNGGIEAFDFHAPEGYTLGDQMKGRGTWYGQPSPIGIQAASLIMSGEPPGSQGMGGSFSLKATGALARSQHSTVHVLYLGGTVLGLELEAGATRNDAFFERWRAGAWKTLFDTAHQRHLEDLQLLQEQRNRLAIDLTTKDTLTLRRIEREEILRTSLEWLLGPGFSSAPPDVTAVIDRILGREEGPPSNTRDIQDVSGPEWKSSIAFGEYVKFLQQAVEWESILYFLYPYFWAPESLAREKLLFDHPDPLHRDFLRAGFARVVLPVRPGFEATFTQLVETGSLNQTGPQSPYLTVAQEIAAFARTNYPGIAPANAEKADRPLLYPQQRATWETMQKVVDLLEKHRTTQGQYPPSLNAVTGAALSDAWGRPLVYRNPGSGNDYDLISFGADGNEGGTDLDADIAAGAAASLVATWYDYTPTSGIDIDVVQLALH